MRAEVRPRRAALPPHPRPHPPSTTGAVATEPRGAQGSGGSGRRGPGAQAQSLLRVPGRCTVSPAGRVEEPRSRYP